jgi:hypothetical protein
MAYTVTFDGVDGAVIAAGGPISQVSGSPTYEDDIPSTHGNMSGRFSSGTSHTCIRCNTSTTTHTGSLYLYIPQENDTHVRFVTFGDIANSATVCNIRLRTSRVLTLANASTVDQVTGLVVIPLNQWVRVDWQYNNANTAAPVLTVRLFLDAEGTTHDEELSFTFTGTTNVFERINFGVVGTAAVTNRQVILDTPIRITDGISSWPAPFDPPDPPSGVTTTLWNGTTEVPVTTTYWNGTAEVALPVTEITS